MKCGGTEAKKTLRKKSEYVGTNGFNCKCPDKVLLYKTNLLLRALKNFDNLFYVFYTTGISM